MTRPDPTRPDLSPLHSSFGLTARAVSAAVALALSSSPVPSLLAAPSDLCSTTLRTSGLEERPGDRAELEQALWTEGGNFLGGQVTRRDFYEAGLEERADEASAGAEEQIQLRDGTTAPRADVEKFFSYLTGLWRSEPTAFRLLIGYVRNPQAPPDVRGYTPIFNNMQKAGWIDMAKYFVEPIFSHVVLSAVREGVSDLDDMRGEGLMLVSPYADEAPTVERFRQLHGDDPEPIVEIDYRGGLRRLETARGVVTAITGENTPWPVVWISSLDSSLERGVYLRDIVSVKKVLHTAGGLEEAGAVVRQFLTKGTQEGTVVAIGPSVFSALSPEDAARLRALLNVATQMEASPIIEVPPLKDQEARHQRVVELSRLNGSVPVKIHAYHAGPDEALTQFLTNAGILDLRDVTIYDANTTGLLAFLAQLQAALRGVPVTAVGLESLQPVVGALDFLA